MNNYHLQILSNFHIVGISYHNMPTSLRGQFAVNTDQYFSFLSRIKAVSDVECFLLSTCNRTEIYFFGNIEAAVVQSFCAVTEVDQVVLNAYAYRLEGVAAIRHLFKVATGLDSQILGDYEIVGQLKRSFHFAQEQGCIQILMERLFNHVLQAARSVRTNTNISGGTISVAFSAAQFAHKYMNATDDKIIIIGAGEIGRNTAINLQSLIPGCNLSIANRTLEKAILLAEEINCNYLELPVAMNVLADFDVIILASNASQYLLDKNMLSDTKENYVLIDLSIPQNINPNVQLLKSVHYANVDIISTINDETLRARTLEIPKVELIIDQHYMELMEWLNLRKMVPMIKEVKEKLQSLEDFVLNNSDKEKKPVIQKVINTMTSKLKDKELSKPGCNYIETYVEYFEKMSNPLEK